jgi:hypothetical protein
METANDAYRDLICPRVAGAALGINKHLREILRVLAAVWCAFLWYESTSSAI